MACATKFPALGDDTKYGTVSPISSTRHATWIEAICHCKSSNAAVVFDSYWPKLHAINKNKPAIISNTSSAASTRKIERANGKWKSVRICMKFAKERTTKETNNMFRTCLRCHKLGLQRVFQISHCWSKRDSQIKVVKHEKSSRSRGFMADLWERVKVNEGHNSWTSGMKMLFQALFKHSLNSERAATKNYDTCLRLR